MTLLRARNPRKRKEHAENMNPVHLHLMLTHVPLFGSGIALLLLFVAIWRRSDELKRVSFGLLVLTALLTVPLYFTGEAAEDAVEHLPGVVESTIDPHEDAAKIAFASMLVTGAVALSSFALFRRGRLVPNWFVALVLALTLVTVGMMAWTSNLGGQIRHTEIGSGNSPPAADKGKHHD
jgi:hypothetical protein